MAKKGKWFLFVSIVLVAVLLFAGCAPKEAPPAAPAQPDQAEEAPADPRADWPSTLTLGTAGVGGVYFVYGGGLGALVDEVVGIPVNIEQTGGPADNMMLVHDGAIDLGMITMGIGYEAWNGLEGTAFAGEPHTNVRALFPMYSTYSQWWVHKNSGIKSLHDLAGKKVGVGPTGGTPGTYHPLILELLGIDAQPVWGATADLVESHIDGQIDANSQATGLPMSGLLSYEAQVGAENVLMLAISGQDREKIIEAFPYWAPGVIPADTYDNLKEDLETIVIFNWAICRKDLPDSLVYAIVDAVMSNHDRMLDVHAAAAETVPENVVTNTFLPLHRGAYQWFVDNGYGDLIPPGAMPID